MASRSGGRNTAFRPQDRTITLVDDLDRMGCIGQDLHIATVDMEDETCLFRPLMVFCHIVIFSVRLKYIFSKDILKRRRAKAEDAFYMKKGDVYQDEHLTIRAFGSTDVGISFLIETQGKQIFHAGDLNNWHWKDESTPQEVAEAEGNYLKELDIIAKYTQAMDVVMFPVDPRLGTDFMRGAQQFIDRIKTGIFVPMHFWERPAEVMAFAPYAESKGCRYVVLSVPGEGTDI